MKEDTFRNNLSVNIIITQSQMSHRHPNYYLKYGLLTKEESTPNNNNNINKKKKKKKKNNCSS